MGGRRGKGREGGKGKEGVESASPFPNSWILPAVTKFSFVQF